MAIYDAGTASIDSDGRITGVGTTWRQPLTLIRVGATIVFKTNPVSIFTISEIISDTEMNAFNNDGISIPAGTGYAILAHDGITVQGLAQDVAETLRYYQSRETSIQEFLTFLESFDIDEYENIVQQTLDNANAAAASATQAANSEAASQSSAQNSATSAAASQESYQMTSDIIANAGDAGTLVTLAGYGIASDSPLVSGFDWQLMSFVAGQSLRTTYSQMINTPDGLVYTPNDLNLWITVEAASTNIFELRVIPITSVSSRFRTYAVRVSGAAGSRTFQVREELSSAIPVTIEQGGTGAVSALGALSNFGLTASSGSSFIGYGSRTVEAKLNDTATLEDFGGAADGGVTDNSLAFRRAIDAGKRRILLAGAGVYGIATPNIELPENFVIESTGQGTCEIKYFGTDSSFTAFTITGAQGPSSWKNGPTIRNVTLSSDTQINFIVATYCQNVNFSEVFFYNAKVVMNDFHYVNFANCRLIASDFVGRANIDGAVVSESPKFVQCFFSNSPIDIRDTADLMLIGCTLFAGEFMVRTGTDRQNVVSPDRAKGFPVLFANTVFDASQGNAWDLSNVAYASITNCFISCGRTTNQDGGFIRNMYSSNISNCSFTYCGRFGLTIEDSLHVGISNCNFNGNQSGGLSLINCDGVSVTGGSNGNTYVQGGYYVQPVGITSPADNCRNTVISGVNFSSDLTTKIYLSTDITTGNRIISCTNVYDSISAGSVAQRPSSPQYGQYYYDREQGRPIWFNSVTGTWKDAFGNDA